MVEFHVEHSGLNLVQTAVAASEGGYVFFGEAVVGQCPHHLRQFGVVGGYGTAVAQCAEVFARIETVACCVAEGAGALCVVETAVGLGVVLDEEEVVLLAEGADGGGVGASSVEVDEHEDFGAWCDGLDEGRGVEVERVFVHIDEHGLESVFGDGQDGGDEGVGWHQHFVSFCEFPHFHVGTEGECEGIQSIGHADTVSGADVGGIVLFKQVYCFALQIASAACHLCYSLLDFLAVQCRHFFQTEIGYVHVSHS